MLLRGANAANGHGAAQESADPAREGPQMRDGVSERASPKPNAHALSARSPLVLFGTFFKKKRNPEKLKVLDLGRNANGLF